MILAARSRSIVGSRIDPGNTPLQQVKGAGVAARGQDTQGLPLPVRSVSVAVAKSGTNRTLRVTFQQNPSDPYYITSKVYVRYASGGNPVHVASGTSPVNVTLQSTKVPATVFVVSSGNWGDHPLHLAPGRAVNLA